jgi:DNA-binding transcriptional LysR family regulator
MASTMDLVKTPGGSVRASPASALALLESVMRSVFPGTRPICNSDDLIGIIHMVNLCAIDLNLLVVLDALLTESSVTRAGRRLGLSQPAVSNALGRLRDLLGDPLLIRGPSGMAATPRAEALRGPLARLLRDARTVVAPPAPFDPTTDERTFTVAATEYVAATVVPALVTRLRGAAPSMTLRVEAMDLASKAIQFRALTAGGVDLVLGLFPRAVHMPAGYAAEMLAADEIVIIGRRGHPALRVRPFLPALRDAGFVRTPSRAADPIASWLAARGLVPRIVATVPTLDLALRVAAASDLLLLAGRRLIGGTRLPVVSARLPFRLDPLGIIAAWSQASAGSPAHVWFRELVRASVAPRACAEAARAASLLRAGGGRRQTLATRAARLS